MFNRFMRIVNAVVIIFLMSKSYGSTIESTNYIFIRNQVEQVSQQLYTCFKSECFIKVISQLNDMLDSDTLNRSLKEKVLEMKKLASLKWLAGYRSDFDWTAIHNATIELVYLEDNLILKKLEEVKLELSNCKNDDCYSYSIDFLNDLLLKTRNNELELKILHLRSSGFKKWEELVKFNISHGVER